MKKISSLLCILLILLSFSACSRIEETDAKEVANTLIEYIEQGDYDSATNLFCANEDDGKSFSDFLNEVETETGFDFQSNIKILGYSEYNSALNTYFGAVRADFNINVIIDGEEMMVQVGVLENEGALECYWFVICAPNSDYEFLCDYID